MTINELRIGNFVGYKDSTSPYIYEVRSISNDRLHPINLIEYDTEKKHGYSVDVEHIDDLNPIPLSEDILVKAGFEKENGDFQAFIYKDTAICTFWDGVEWIFKFGSDSDLSFAACEYVHELQNLIYCLRKEEITIEL